MQIFKRLSILVVIVALFSSCATVYYAPNTHNIPLLKEQGEVKIQGGIGMAQDVRTTEFQGAFAVTDRFAVMSNYSYFYGRGEGLFELQNDNAHLLEVGGGYTLPFANDNLIFEVYGGYGFGTGTTWSDPGNTDFSLNRFFIQPDIAFSSDILDAGFSLRGAFHNYYSVQHNPEVMVTQPHVLQEGSNYFMAEPAVFVRVGYRFIKAQMQAGWSVNLTDPAFRQQPFLISGMLVIDIRKSFFKN